MSPPTTSADLLIATGTWRLDPEESRIGFRISALPPAKGRFSQAEGELVVDDDHRGTVNASIEVDSLEVGPRLRDNHLKSSHFFDAASHPRIIFRSERIQQDEDEIRIAGILSIRGHEHPLEIGGKVSPGGPDAIRLQLSAQINRRDFGITWLWIDRFMFSNRVILNLDLLARRV
jgi:polyisoprenoid-binding protein YceI